MAFLRSLIAALSLSSLVLQASAIAVVADDICPIPYIVPRALQFQSDPVDEYITKELLPKDIEKGHKGAHPQWISSMLIRTRPNVWTIEPYCLRSIDAKSDICVWTSTWFARGRGVSFVSFPSEGPLLAQAPALWNQTTFEYPSFVNPDVDERMEKVPIPGKGLGMRATRLMLRGDMAQSYTPTIVIQDSVMQMPLNTWEQNTPLEIAVRWLPKKARDVFNALHGQFGGNPVYDKVNTNAFNALIGSSDQFFWSIYPETAVSFQGTETRR